MSALAVLFHSKVGLESPDLPAAYSALHSDHRGRNNVQATYILGFTRAVNRAGALHSHFFRLVSHSFWKFSSCAEISLSQFFFTMTEAQLKLNQLLPAQCCGSFCEHDNCWCKIKLRVET